MLDRLTHHCHIVETENESYRFRNSSTQSNKEGNQRKSNTSLKKLKSGESIFGASPGSDLVAIQKVRAILLSKQQEKLAKLLPTSNFNEKNQFVGRP